MEFGLYKVAAQCTRKRAQLKSALLRLRDYTAHSVFIVGTRAFLIGSGQLCYLSLAHSKLTVNPLRPCRSSVLSKDIRSQVWCRIKEMPRWFRSWQGRLRQACVSVLTLQQYSPPA